MADTLAKLASLNIQSKSEPIYWNELLCPSIMDSMVNEVHCPRDWRTIIIQYILEEALPAYKHQARSLIHQATNYCVVEVKLYHRVLTEPLLRCLGLEEARQIIEEVLAGIYGGPLGGKNIMAKVLLTIFKKR